MYWSELSDSSNSRLLNCQSKRKKSSQNKTGRLDDSTLSTPVREIHFKRAIYELWRMGEGLQILENKQNGGQISSQNTA